MVGGTTLSHVDQMVTLQLECASASCKVWASPACVTTGALCCASIACSEGNPFLSTPFLSLRAISHHLAFSCLTMLFVRTSSDECALSCDGLSLSESLSRTVLLTWQLMYYRL